MTTPPFTRPAPPRAALLVFALLAVACDASAPPSATPAPPDASPDDDALVARFHAQREADWPHEGAQPRARDGAVRILWPDGALAAEGTMRDGRREGLWRRYRRDGRRLEEGRYERDVPVGAWRAWDANGTELAPTEHAPDDCDGEGPIPLPLGLPCGLAGLPPDRAHHEDALPLRRCIGPWRDRLRQSLAEEAPSGELANAMRFSESAEVLDVVRDAVEVALDDAVADPAVLREGRAIFGTGMRHLADLGDLALRHRAVRDLEGALGHHALLLYAPVTDRALRVRPGFDAVWYRALQARRAQEDEAEARYGLERAERSVFGAVAYVDERTGVALMRHALAAGRDDAGLVHQLLARVAALRGDPEEAHAQWAEARALYAERRCERCLVDLERTVGMVAMERRAPPREHTR